MAQSLNQVNIIGNLGRDAEVKSTHSGQTVVIVSLATNEGWKDRETGDWVPDTEWHRVVFYGAAADALAAQHMRKGETLYVGGKIKTRKWNDQNGNERHVTEIIGNTFVPMREQRDSNQSGHAPQQGRQTHGTQQQPRPQGQQRPAPQQPAQNYDSKWEFDDVPF